MNKRIVWAVGIGAAGLATAYALRRLLERDEVRAKLGLPPMSSDDVDVNSSDSFPASDPPGFNTTTAAR